MYSLWLSSMFIFAITSLDLYLETQQKRYKESKKDEYSRSDHSKNDVMSMLHITLLNLRVQFSYTFTINLAISAQISKIGGSTQRKTSQSAVEWGRLVLIIWVCRIQFKWNFGVMFKISNVCSLLALSNGPFGSWNFNSCYRNYNQAIFKSSFSQ